MISTIIRKDTVKSPNYIMVVEDSPIDVEILARAFRKADFSPSVHHCSDGDSAVEFLEGLCHDGSLAGQFPSMVLLDLNLPGTDGREVLTIIKNSDCLRKIPVVILSSSNNESDVSYCFSVGADKYLRKPISAEEFADTVAQIKQFWQERV